MDLMFSSKGDKIFKYVNMTVVTLIMFIVLYPLIYVLSCSISSPNMVAVGKIILFPKEMTLLGYKRVFQDPNIMLGYKNTIIYTLFGTLINLFVTVPAGYSLSKKELPGNKIIMMFFLITMYFSGGIVPTFLLIRGLGMYNTRAVLLILGAFSTYNCIVCRSFFLNIPKELEEAAYIDGCPPIRTFIQIILPLSKALMGVMVLYFGIGHWNAYFNALMFVNDNKFKPLQLFLRDILIQATESAEMMDDSDEELMQEALKVKELIKYSCIVVASLPVLIIYPFFEKYFSKGVLIGSIKG